MIKTPVRIDKMDCLDSLFARLTSSWMVWSLWVASMSGSVGTAWKVSGGFVRPDTEEAQLSPASAPPQ